MPKADDKYGMWILDATWNTRTNLLRIKCACGHTFHHRTNLWKVRCTECGAYDHINRLRNRWVQEHAD